MSFSLANAMLFIAVQLFVTGFAILGMRLFSDLTDRAKMTYNSLGLFILTAGFMSIGVSMAFDPIANAGNLIIQTVIPLLFACMALGYVGIVGSSVYYQRAEILARVQMAQVVLARLLRSTRRIARLIPVRSFS